MQLLARSCLLEVGDVGEGRETSAAFSSGRRIGTRFRHQLGRQDDSGAIAGSRLQTPEGRCTWVAGKVKSNQRPSSRCEWSADVRCFVAELTLIFRLPWTQVNQQAVNQVTTWKAQPGQRWNSRPTQGTLITRPKTPGRTINSVGSAGPWIRNWEASIGNHGNLAVPAHTVR